MKATAKLLVTCVTCGLLGITLPATAAPHPTTSSAAWGSLVLQQTASEKSPRTARAKTSEARPATPDRVAPASKPGARRPDVRFQSPPGPSNEPADQPSRSPLLEARHAVAHGELERARELLQQAASDRFVDSRHKDSPAQVRTLIEEAERISKGPPKDGQQRSLEAFERARVRFLMDQAESLAHYQDFETARQLAELARKTPLQFGIEERGPSELLEQIRVLERAARRSAPGELSGDPDSARLPPAAHPRKAEVMRLLAEAQVAIDRGDFLAAKQAVDRAMSARVPNEEFTPREPTPWKMQIELNKRMARDGGVVPATAFERAKDNEDGGPPQVARSIYEADADATEVQPAQGTLPAPRTLPDGPVADDGVSGNRLYREGVQALERQDRKKALSLFREAWQHQAEMDPVLRQQLKDKLTLLQSAPARELPPGADDASPLGELDQRQQVLRERLFREIAAEQRLAQEQGQRDPKGARERLQKLRERVNDADLESSAKKQLLTIVDRNLQGLDRYIQQNAAQIDLDERNAEVLEDISNERKQRGETQDEMAKLVEEFNKLMDEHRFMEAEALARKAREMDPDSVVVQQLIWKSRFGRQFAENMTIREKSDEGFAGAMLDVQRSKIAMRDEEPLSFDKKRWDELTPGRLKQLERERMRGSPAEQEIRQKLKEQVQVSFDKRPISEVIETLEKAVGVNMHLDPLGLGAEAVTAETPVTLNLSQPISLRSALNLILEPLQLSYVVENEVIRITSADVRDEHVVVRAYRVADLVIPIPNFVPTHGNFGLAGSIREGYDVAGYQRGLSPGGLTPMTIAENDAHGKASNSVLAQMAAAMPTAPGGGRVGSQLGAPGLGGGFAADFDPLVELITTTIKPSSWDEVGGSGTIQPVDANLSLVVSNTQDVHEQIADLLEQLRRLQDLQVAIEVRFITLNDNFFERIGIDFDFKIEDNAGISRAQAAVRDSGPSVSFGVNPGTIGNLLATPTTDLDFTVSTDTFTSTVPTVGGFDPNSGARFGFAILSDIEAFFFVQAATGNNRSNVLQAPRVTLFNGQSGIVFDGAQRPFVTSVIPVVGDFAAAQQPVIAVLNEGTMLNVQAVVSSDRRFVRLTLMPTFSRVGNVDTFTFEGTKTSDTTTTDEPNPQNPNGPPRSTTKNNVSSSTGSTVQLPTFEITTIATTVSVPDGGTILMGGIKRLNEQRQERGVPFLKDVPYVNRLFKNVGIGRTASSLMMMVTPRIIIQEEEELRQTGVVAGQ